MPFGKFSKMVLIFALKVNPTSPNTAKEKPQADRLLILTANHRDTPPETQKKPLRRFMTEVIIISRSKFPAVDRFLI